MALDASELYVAGTGNIYAAPQDTALPTGTTPPTTPWVEMGYATEDGVEFTFGKTTDAIKGWQSFDTLRLLTTEAPKSVKFTLMQANKDTLLLALGGGSFDDQSGTYTPPDASVLDMRALYVTAVDGGEKWAFWAPRVLLSDNVVIPWKKTGVAEFPLTFSVQAAEPPFQFVFPGLGTGGTQQSSSQVDEAA